MQPECIKHSSSLNVATGYKPWGCLLKTLHAYDMWVLFSYTKYDV